jgi:pimeloyl-ACP methyl ester carboxylesterase
VQHAELDGLRVAYRSFGGGQPLLLLHGGWSEGWEWHRQLDALSDRWHVVAWDAPGCGGSDDPPPGWELADYARCVIALCRDLGLERPHLGGLSFGAGLALEVYRQDPGLPRSLLLLSAYAGWAGSLPRKEVRARLAACEDLAASSAPPTLEDGLAFTGPAPDLHVLEELLVIARRARPQAAVGQARAFAAADLRDVLPDIAVPTLVMHGAEDRRCPLPVGRAIAEAIPGAELVVVPGVGHALHQEAPGPVEAVIRAFLERVEGAEAAGSL